MSSAFTIFAKKVSREKRIPFGVSIDSFYLESNICHLEKEMEEYKAGNLQLAEHEKGMVINMLESGRCLWTKTEINNRIRDGKKVQP